MSRLALLVPARNAQELLPRLYASVEAQTVPFDEVLVYDDASTDRTGDVARARGARVVRSDVNTGPSVGKNRLAAETSCEWVHFHDADDALYPEFVARARRWMEMDTADVVLFGTEDRDHGSDARLERAGWDDAALMNDPVAYAIQRTITNCGVYRRDAFLRCGGFNTDPAASYNEDQAMHLRLALGGLTFRADDYTSVIIYRRQSSMSSGHPIECARAHVDVLMDVAERTGTRYSREIGARAWHLAGVCAGYLDWTYVDRSLQLAHALGYRDPQAEHWAIRAAARVSAYGAVKLREIAIRTLKPALRRNMPTIDRRSPAGA